MTDIVERLRDEWHHSEDLCFEAADEIERLRHDISRLMSSLSGEVTESERLRQHIREISEAYKWWTEDQYDRCQSVVGDAIHSAIDVLEGTK